MSQPGRAANLTSAAAEFPNGNIKSMAGDELAQPYELFAPLEFLPTASQGGVWIKQGDPIL